MRHYSSESRHFGAGSLENVQPTRDQIPVLAPRFRDAAASAAARLALLRDTLKLAEQAKPYIRGEQWAVSAVRALRGEVADFERYHVAPADQLPTDIAAQICPVFRCLTGSADLDQARAFTLARRVG